MLVFARRKKLWRDDRLLQLIFLISLLNGLPNNIFDEDDRFSSQDLHLGSSLGHIHFHTGISSSNLHPKSLDCMLTTYREQVLNDIQALGHYDRLPSRFQHLQAYLLNAQLSLSSPVTQSDRGGSADSHSTDPQRPESEETSENSDGVLTTEDLKLIEALWLQDVDIGIPRELLDEEFDEVQKFDVGSATKDKDIDKQPHGGTELENGDDMDDIWASANFTLDGETGELLALGPKNSTPFSNGDSGFGFEFNIDEALGIVEGCDSPSEERPRGVHLSPSSPLNSEGNGAPERLFSLPDSPELEGDDRLGSLDSLEALSDTLDDMIQASQMHHHRSLQGRLGGLVRSGSMEQRWQDLASLLSVPSPDPAHHTAIQSSPLMGSHAPPPPLQVQHPQAVYPGGAAAPSPSHDVPVITSPGLPRGVLLHNATLTGPMPDHIAHNMSYGTSMGASSHLVSTSMNLTNSGEITGSDPHSTYKLETPSSLPSDAVYYQQANSSEMNQTNDGFLSSFLNEEELPFMDIPMNSDFTSRGPPANDYGPPGNYRFGLPEESHRIAPVAQKKHQMFGKRFFQDNAHGAMSGSASGVGVSGLGGYPGHYNPVPVTSSMEGATALDPSDMKFTCPMDYRSSGQDLSVSLPDHVQHNHTYHMSPDGPSGLMRPATKERQKGKKTDSERSLTRDEKRARALNLPISCDDIINMPMDEFNERISKYDLTEPQLSLIRDIRRRGKNKVAAQNCRKRKLDQIVNLAEEVRSIQGHKSDLRNEYECLRNEREQLKHKFALLYKHIFQSLRDPEGNHYSQSEFSLQQSADGSVLLVRRSAHPAHSSDPSLKHDQKDMKH